MSDRCRCGQSVEVTHVCSPLVDVPSCSQPSGDASRGASTSRDAMRIAYPLDCPNCGLWLTYSSTSCPRCFVRLPAVSAVLEHKEPA